MVRRFSLVCSALLFVGPAWAGVQTQENTRWIGVAPSNIDQIEIDKQTDGITRYYDDGFGTFTFAVEDRSVWGPSGPSEYVGELSLTPSQWDSVFGRAPRARVGVGAIGELCVPVLGCAKAGAAAGIELEAYILPYAELEFDPGTFDAIVNYKPTVKYQSTGLGLDFSQLETSSGEFGGKLTLEEPSIYLQAGLTIDTAINLFAEACLGGCFIDESFEIVDFKPFDVPLVTLDTRADSQAVIDNEGPIFEIFYPDPSRLDNTFIGVEDLLFDPVNAIAGAGREVLYLDAGALLADAAKDAATGAVNDAGQVVREELSDDGKKAYDALENSLSPISVDLSLPWATSAAQSNGLSGQFGGELLKLELDIDKVIGYAFGLKDGLEFDLGNYGVPDVIDAKVVLGDAKAGPVVELQTEVSLSPELMVNLQFDSEVYIAGKIGKQTSYQGSWDDLPAIGLTSDAYILRQDEAGKWESPDDKTVTAMTDFSIQATLDNRTYLDLKATASLELLSASIDIKGDGLPGLSLGPVLEYEVTSESLGQLDIFNDSFAVTNWSKSVSNNTGPGATDKLEFNAFGEILFQARGKGTAADVFYDNDARIDANLSTVDVINAQEARASAAAPDGGIYGYVESTLPEFYETIKSELKIDNRTAAHVMEDGLFTNNAGKTLTIEQGGNLELGKSNPFEPRSLANERLAEPPSQAGGLVNEGVMQVFGEVFSNAVIDNPNYVFRNASKTGFSTPILEVGASGRVKFDGTFINDGFVQNYGSIELTGESNRSSNSWDNKYGGNLDLYGKLDVSRPDFSALTNSGTIRVHEGAELEIIRKQARSATEPSTSIEGHPSYADVHNYGHLNIASGAELRLSGAGGAELLNLGTVSNSGFTLNNTGQLITNGTSALAFDSLIGPGDLWETGQANMVRNNSLAAINAEYDNFVDKNVAMQTAVTDYRNARVEWLGTNNESEQARAERTFALGVRAFGTGEGGFQGDKPGLNVYRQKDGIIDEAYGKVSALIDTMKASGFAVWENLSGGLLVNEGTFDNNAVMVNHMGASVFNSGELNNQGYLRNTGLLVNNQPEGSVQNTGRIDNGSPSLGLVGLSETVNLSNFNNRGELVNHDTLVNYGTLDNRDDGTSRTQTTKVQNNGSLSNLGTLENQAAYANARGAETNNYGVINNDGVLDNHGFINNGVQGTSVAQTDVSQTATDAGNFYAAIQQLSNNKQDLENLNQQYENESARLRRIGFMGMLNEGEAGENTEAWATFLYEKYLVSNLADQSDNSQFFGPNQGSLEADRKFIRDEVLKEGNSDAKARCETSQLECYKAYFGGRENSFGGSTTALNYDFGYASGESDGINGLSQYELTSSFQNGVQGDDENRFLWTLLMMLEAEGLGGDFRSVLECARNTNCAPNGGPGSDNPNDKDSFDRFFEGYGGDNKITGIDGYYASWTDQVAFDGNYYERKGGDLSLAEVNDFSNPAAKLAGLYKNRQAAVQSINDTINTNSLATLGFNAGSIPNLSDLENIDFRALVTGLGSALRTASFDLAAVTSLDAELKNTGTINNRGVINNRATINNEEEGTINNSGALIIGATGTLNNDGDVILNDFELSNGEVQSGLLMSHGTIDNNQTGLIEIVSGTLINGRTRQQITDSDGKFVRFGDIISEGVINNHGEIKLSATAQFLFQDILNADGTPATDPSTGAALQEAKFIFTTASLINEGKLNNFVGALLQIGQDDSFLLENRLFSLNVLTNSGEIYNDGTLKNYGTLNNSGLVENRTGSEFVSKGLINNTGEISFADSAALGGEIINDGLISMSAGELLTLTGRISGNGTFMGDTLLDKAAVSPGQSPGLLTFDGDVVADEVSWIMEIWGTERGLAGGYDGVDITGDFTLLNGMTLNILSLLDFDEISGQAFNFLSIGKDLIGAGNALIETTLDFSGFADSMLGFWDGQWVRTNNVWDLVLEFVGTKDDYEDLYGGFQAAFLSLQATDPQLPPGPGPGPVSVPEPGTLQSLALGLVVLWWMGVRRRRSSRALA